jgi:hypothetical protein
MTSKINTDAPARWDSEDDRPGTVDVSRDMILDYVYSPDGDCILHVQESAEAFADWAYEVWFEYHGGMASTTNKDILDGMLADWRGDVPRETEEG